MILKNISNISNTYKFSSIKNIKNTFYNHYQRTLNLIIYLTIILKNVFNLKIGFEKTLEIWYNLENTCKLLKNYLLYKKIIYNGF